MVLQADKASRMIANIRRDLISLPSTPISSFDAAVAPHVDNQGALLADEAHVGIVAHQFDIVVPAPAREKRA